MKSYIKLNEFWETHMESFCSGRKSAFQLSSELIFALNNYQNISIIDIACGYGGWSEYLEKKAQEQNIKIKFTGIDNSEERLEVYKNILGESSETKKGDILSILPKLLENYFDSAILGWASHEIEMNKLELIYQQIHQNLKPEGVLLIADFVSGLNPKIEYLNSNIIKTRREKLLLDPKKNSEEKQLRKNNSKSKHVHKGKKHHKQHYSIKDHFNFLNKVGFSTIEEVWRYTNSSMILAIK